MVATQTVHYRRSACADEAPHGIGHARWIDPVTQAGCEPFGGDFDLALVVVIDRETWPFRVMVERATAERAPSLSAHSIALRYFAAYDRRAEIAAVAA